MTIDEMTLREEIARAISKIPVCGPMSALDMRELAVKTARGEGNYMTEYFDRQEAYE